jgi:hypothetical protein
LAQNVVTLNAVFDDVTNRITLTGYGPPPPQPATLPAGTFQWVGQTGPGFEISFNVQPKNLTGNPTAIYVKEVNGMIERWLVEYISGAWQMPGTRMT